LGWECSGGSSTQPDACNEKCGDGYDLGHFECDDGNTDDYDGCSSSCEIETGYLCDDGTTESPDIC